MPAAFSLIPRTCGGLGGGELLEVPQRQHLAVERVHGVQGLLEPELDLGPDGFLAGPGQIAQELGRQRRRGGFRHRPAVDRHLAPRVAHLGTQVVAMDLAQLVARDAPQPEEERHRGPPEIGPQVLPGLQVGVLEHVGRIDAPLEPLIQAEGDHAAQPRTAPAHEASQLSASPSAASRNSSSFSLVSSGIEVTTLIARPMKWPVRPPQTAQVSARGDSRDLRQFRTRDALLATTLRLRCLERLLKPIGPVT